MYKIVSASETFSPLRRPKRFFYTGHRLTRVILFELVRTSVMMEQVLFCTPHNIRVLYSAMCHTVQTLLDTCRSLHESCYTIAHAFNLTPFDLYIF